MRVLVLGGAGFIGSHLVDRLLDDGHFVRVLDRSPPELHPDWVKAGRVEYVLGDFSDHFAIAAAVKDVDVAFHTVSTTIPATSNVDMEFDVQSNLIGTINFLKEAVAARIRKVLFVSSGGTVYGTPATVPITSPPIASNRVAAAALASGQRPAAQFHGGHNLRRPGRPDARHSRQIVAPCLHEAVQAAACRQQLVRDDKCAALMTAAADHQGDQFVVAEGAGAVHQQFLARPVVRGELFHRTRRESPCKNRAQRRSVRYGVMGDGFDERGEKSHWPTAKQYEKSAPEPGSGYLRTGAGRCYSIPAKGHL